jgi:hypothetical protein
MRKSISVLFISSCSVRGRIVRRRKIGGRGRGYLLYEQRLRAGISRSRAYLGSAGASDLMNIFEGWSSTTQKRDVIPGVAESWTITQTELSIPSSSGIAPGQTG